MGPRNRWWIRTDGDVILGGYFGRTGGRELGRLAFCGPRPVQDWVLDCGWKQWTEPGG